MSENSVEIPEPRGELINRAISRLENQPSDFIPSLYRFGRYTVRRGVDKLIDGVNSSRSNHFLHYCVHDPRGNAGDTVLFRAVREVFDSELGSHVWVRRQLRKRVTSADLKEMDDKAACVVLGGGGLMMSDLRKPTVSGWQWNIAKNEVENMRPPLVVYATGYNQFRGMSDFNDTFNSHVETVLKKSAFFGLRNNGSIEKLKRHTDESLHSKIRFQPCPTTVLRKFHSDLQENSRAKSRKILAVNLAFDRPEMRYGNNISSIIHHISKALKWAVGDGWTIKLAIHGFQDEPAVQLLRHEGVKFEIVRLNLLPWKDIVAFYAETPLTLGARGHAQMIPFGVGNAIISLISHDKLGFFLDDIGHPEWGVEVSDPNSSETLIENIRYYWQNQDDIHIKIDNSQNYLWEVTKNNFEEIKRNISL